MDINTILTELNFQPITVNDQVTITGGHMFLLVKVKRASGLTEEAVFFDEDSTFNYRPFKGYRANKVARNTMIRELHKLGIKQQKLSLYFQLSQSSICNLIKGS
jgi:hypothetical protein